jgi:hypothetical protein
VFHLHRQVCIKYNWCLDCSEMLVFKLQTPVNHLEGNIQPFGWFESLLDHFALEKGDNGVCYRSCLHGNFVDTV